MSKFTFAREGMWHVLNTNGAPQARYTEKALIELHAAISAHLAEHNSGVMGGHGCGVDTPVCGKEFSTGKFSRAWLVCMNPVGADERGVTQICGHPKACHSTQNTKDQDTRTEG